MLVKIKIKCNLFSEKFIKINNAQDCIFNYLRLVKGLACKRVGGVYSELDVRLPEGISSEYAMKIKNLIEEDLNKFCDRYVLKKGDR